ncbi:ABC transporter ATP-binding protein [Roseinatronobacter bogoriensis]|uniref:ABC transporter ATP-binding protein n=1 Tax=Roseinatronobacter bogoriensis subsp. barguzinensis TaxID=441209 RepID=A0A2K8KBW6_9RHOB|nr:MULTISPECIES: ATP-binding cassette domain-containing protein [Rhodobaca]ATX65413.1 ABC transporter ATP-binding protein [Rhodobaca barguzinensis]MBB4209000.1 putative hydroxymethylpyrimidine transport system ATP-binding protein [Rhodobaca bogoriensis DSM 18756]TDW37575.1 putative hydroxymethylpyrimidine transport system ATP-binding protein [Rhodobaca barguzinensis]TDY68185.1 putative hydroxymethylpyrimidine transport system ATP-binding protein [Rhodobaca bogoriensis DSM 18756]
MTTLRLRGDLWMGTAPLIRDLALDLPASRWSGLLGPSGVGKSTLARLVAGLPGPYRLEGAICPEDGKPLQGRVAMMAQEGQLLPWADCVQNVTIGARLRGVRPDVTRARALLAQVGLKGLERRRPAALSGGQRQRVALARVLMEDCPIVVLDEPFSALDTLTRLAMQDLAASLLQGRTVILITHDPLEAIRLSDQAYLLGPDGAEVLNLPASPVPRDYTAPETLAAQAQMLARLHRVESETCAG